MSTSLDLHICAVVEVNCVLLRVYQMVDGLVLRGTICLYLGCGFVSDALRIGLDMCYAVTAAHACKCQKLVYEEFVLHWIMFQATVQ